jgi:hypothetical protein
MPERVDADAPTEDRHHDVLNEMPQGLRIERLEALAVAAAAMDEQPRLGRRGVSPGRVIDRYSRRASRSRGTIGTRRSFEPLPSRTRRYASETGSRCTSATFRFTVSASLSPE